MTKWPLETERLLGTRTDQEIADQLGLSRYVVGQRRRRLGIPASRPITEWTSEMEALLGTAPDSVIAVQLGLNYLRVRKRRRVLGIPKFRFQSIPFEIPIEVRKASAAYLLGAFLSDGHLSWSGQDPHPTWGVRDESFAESISFGLSNLGCPYDFRKRPSTNSYDKDCWHIREKAAGRFGRWLSKVVPNKKRLPKVPRELVRPLVAGLMDGDGSIGGELADMDHFRLSFSGGEGFVLDFRELLESYNIRQGKVTIKEGPGYRKPCYDWTINIEDFLVLGLTFAMPRKRERLAQWCDKIRRRRYIPSFQDRIEVANWWMDNVYMRDKETKIPLGEIDSPFLSKQ